MAAISTAAVTLIRISFVLGFLAFVTGLTGFIVAVVGVRHTKGVTHVQVPIFPLASPQSFPVAHTDGEVESLAEKRSSKLSLEL